MLGPRGIIPAYAGSTGFESTTEVDKGGSSPRTRGAQMASGAVRAASQGSSPRTRGAPWLCSHTLLAIRDHPRVRGEHHKRPTTKDGVSRIIPAYAGSTVAKDGDGRAAAESSPRTRGAPSTHPPPRACSWDHPRVRGEHVSAQSLRQTRHEIIPAYAGSTRRGSQSDQLPAGSSPRTRGARTGA